MKTLVISNMFSKEEMDWSIYQFYDVRPFKPDSTASTFVDQNAAATSLNDSEDIIKTMIKRERNRIAATKCRCMEIMMKRYFYC